MGQRVSFCECAGVLEGVVGVLLANCLQGVERSTLLHSDLCVSAWERRYLEDATETALAEESDDLEVVDGEGGFRVCIGVFGVRAG